MSTLSTVASNICSTRLQHPHCLTCDICSICSLVHSHFEKRTTYSSSLLPSCRTPPQPPIPVSPVPPTFTLTSVYHSLQSPAAAPTKTKKSLPSNPNPKCLSTSAVNGVTGLPHASKRASKLSAALLCNNHTKKYRFHYILTADNEQPVCHIRKCGATRELMHAFHGLFCPMHPSFMADLRQQLHAAK